MSALLSIHLSSLSLVTQTKRKWKKHHTHTHTQKNKTKTERKISFAFKRTEGWLELFHKKWKGGFWESACGACACEWVCVRARAVFLWTLSLLFSFIEKRKEKGAREIVKWGRRTQKKKGLWSLMRKTFSCLLVLLFFLLLFSFPFSLFPPMSNPKQKPKPKGEKKKTLAKIRNNNFLKKRIGEFPERRYNHK